MFASTSQRNDDGLPHTIGEKLILPAVEEVLKTVLHKPASNIIKRIPLRNNTVERRIDEMSSDIESFLCNYLQKTHFSIQLDESTLPFTVTDSNQTGSVATDGAPAMVGHYREFLSYLKQNVSGFPTFMTIFSKVRINVTIPPIFDANWTGLYLLIVQ